MRITSFPGRSPRPSRLCIALLAAGLHVLGSLAMTVLGLKSLAWWLAR